MCGNTGLPARTRGLGTGTDRVREPQKGGNAARIQKGASMKTSTKIGLLRRVTALALAVVLSIPSALAAAGV